MFDFFPAIEAGFEDKKEFSLLLSKELAGLLEYNKGSSYKKSDSYMPIRIVREKEVRVGPYNLSFAVLAYLSNQKLQIAEERKEAIRKAIGAVLKHRRNELDLGQAELSDKTDDAEKSVSRRTIIRAENGKKLLQLGNLKSICDALELNYFFCLQRASRLYWEIFDDESFPSLKDEYNI